MDVVIVVILAVGLGWTGFLAWKLVGKNQGQGEIRYSTITTAEAESMFEKMGEVLTKNLRSALGLDMQPGVVVPEDDPDEQMPAIVKEYEMDPFMKEVEEWAATDLNPGHQDEI